MASRPASQSMLSAYGPDEAAMAAYVRAGEARAMTLGNRGPIRFDSDGTLAPDILNAYRRCGFYVFEGVLGAAELADLFVRAVEA